MSIEDPSHYETCQYLTYICDDIPVHQDVRPSGYEEAGHLSVGDSTVNYCDLVGPRHVQSRVGEVHVVVQAVVGDMVELETLDGDTGNIPEVHQPLQTRHDRQLVRSGARGRDPGYLCCVSSLDRTIWEGSTVN